MIETVLYDTDGVVIKKRIRFSERFSEDFKVPIEEVLLFFENEFQQCLIGKSDLKKKLGKYVIRWGWKKSVDELLSYWLSCENEKEERIVQNVQSLRQKGMQCYLHTNNEKYRTEYLYNGVGLKDYFDGMFSSYKLEAIKPQQEFWQVVYEKLGKPDTKNVLVWDDDIENVNSAKEFGFQAEHYITYEEYIKKMNEFISTR